MKRQKGVIFSGCPNFIPVPPDILCDGGGPNTVQADVPDIGMATLSGCLVYFFHGPVFPEISPNEWPR